jgi:hypothetical protein
VYNQLFWIMRTLLRCILAVWAAPTPIVAGLTFLPLALVSGGGCRIVHGVVEIYGGLVAFFLRRLVPLPGGALAMTLGRVVLGRDRHALDLTRAHERVHVRQADRWGPLFVPAYLVASLIQLLRGMNPYRDNPFEREAFDTV